MKLRDRIIDVESYKQKIKNKSVIDKESGCWIWTGATIKGYGYLYFTRTKKHGPFKELKPYQYRAHRMSYMLFNGEIPKGHLVRHTCDNPLCVNPDHLLTGTPQDNSNDKMKRGRHRCPVGEAHSHSKLTEADAKRILKNEENWNMSEWARKYGVSSSTIHSLISGHTWKHLERKTEYKVKKRGSLTESDAKRILKNEENWNMSVWARKFGVDISTISYLLSGRTWKHLKRESEHKVKKRTTLTEADVKRIIKNEENWNMPKWAKEFGVKTQTISLLLSGRTWKHIKR